MGTRLIIESETGGLWRWSLERAGAVALKSGDVSSGTDELFSNPDAAARSAVQKMFELAFGEIDVSPAAYWPRKPRS